MYEDMCSRNNWQIPSLEVQPAATKSSSHLKIFPSAKKTIKGNDSSVTSNKKTANVGMSLSDRFAMKAKHGSVKIDSSGNLEINRHKKQQLEGLNLEEKGDRGNFTPKIAIL